MKKKGWLRGEIGGVVQTGRALALPQALMSELKLYTFGAIPSERIRSIRLMQRSHSPPFPHCPGRSGVTHGSEWSDARVNGGTLTRHGGEKNDSDGGDAWRKTWKRTSTLDDGFKMFSRQKVRYDDNQVAENVSKSKSRRTRGATHYHYYCCGPK